MKDMFKDFRKMGEDFRKMGEDLAKGTEELAEGAAQIFEGFDPIFKSSTSTINWNTGDKSSKNWTGTLKTETEHYVLEIPVPGIAPTDLEVRVFANKVRIAVSKAATKEKHDYELPLQIDAKMCLATLQRGVLTLKIQKTGIVPTGVKIEVTEK